MTNLSTVIIHDGATICLITPDEYDETITIFVENQDVKRLQFKINSCTTVKDIKDQIKTKENIPLSKQKLFYRGLEMKDDSYLREYRVFHESTIHLITIFNDDVEINLKLPFYPITLVLNKNYLMKCVKDEINKKFNIPQQNQILTFNGKTNYSHNRYFVKYWKKK